MPVGTRGIRKAIMLGVVAAAALPLSGCVPVTLPGGGEAIDPCLIGCYAPTRPVLDLTAVRQDGAGTLIVRGSSTSDAKWRVTVYEVFLAGDWEEVLTTVEGGVGPRNTIDLGADITLRSEFAPWTRAATALKVRVSQGHPDGVAGVSERVITADRPTLAVDPTLDLVASVGSSETKAVTITNRSAKQTLKVTGLTVGGTGAAAFTAAAGTCAGATLAPGASCTATVTFSPASAGLTGATLSIDSSDPRVREVSLWGSTPGATRPRVSASPASLTLGELDTGVITVTNPDATPVTIGAASIESSATAVFTTTPPGDPARDCSAGATLPGAGSCDVGVFFSGAAPGAATGAVLTVPVTGGRPVTVAINGGVVAGSVAARTRPARRAARGGPTHLAFSGRLRATNRPAGAPRTAGAGIEAPIRTTGSITAKATAPTESAVPPALTRLLSSRFAGMGRLRTDGTRSTIDTVILTRPHPGGRICARLRISGSKKKGGGTLTVLGGTGPAAGLQATAQFQIFSRDRASGRITTRTVPRAPLPAACR